MCDVVEHLVCINGWNNVTPQYLMIQGNIFNFTTEESNPMASRAPDMSLGSYRFRYMSGITFFVIIMASADEDTVLKGPYFFCDQPY